MASNVLELSLDDGATYTKLRVLIADAAQDGTPIAQSEFNEGISAWTSTGVARRRFRYRVIVPEASPPSGFADRAFVLGLLAATGTVKVKPLTSATAYTVLHTNKAAPDEKCLTFARTGADAYYTYDLQFVQP